MVPHRVASQRGRRTGFAHSRQAIAAAMIVSRGTDFADGSSKKPANRTTLVTRTINRSRIVSARAAAHPRAKHHATTGTE
jgi:hypothetical protein